MLEAQTNVLTFKEERMAKAKEPLEIGKNYIVRTVTFHYTGRLKAIPDGWLVLSDAAWVADSGRWADALAKGTLNEVEPYVSEVCINRAAIVDVTAWTHDLPRAQK